MNAEILVLEAIRDFELQNVQIVTIVTNQDGASGVLIHQAR